MAGTDLYYNGIKLKNVLTLEFAQEIVRDPSGTDRVYSEFNVRVQAVLNPALILKDEPNAGLGIFGPTYGTGKVGDILGDLECTLSQDRAPFRYVIDGATVLEWNTKSLGPDLNNGPKVVHVHLAHLSPQTIRVEFGIKVAIRCCEETASDLQSQVVVNNRWSITDDVDDNYRTTRYMRGLLRLTPGGPDKVRNPQQFRGLVVPPLSDGFRRKRMHFLASENMLELGYEIQDEEMLGQAAPWPAAKMSGLHSETIGLDASSSLAQIMVRLEGPRDADKRVMMERCMQIAEQKLQISRLSGGLNVVQGIQVADHFGPEVNAVEVRATARHVAGDGAASSASDGKLSLGAMVMQEMGTPLVLPDYNDQQSLLYGPYGTASIATLFACFLQDPCNIQSTTPGENPTPDSGKDDSTTKKKKSDQQPTAFAFTGDPSSAFKAPAYSSDHEAGIYTFARVETIVNKRPMRVALPIAGDPNDKKNAKKDTVFIATLGLPISYLNVKIQLERNADWPKILTDADFTDSNGIKYSLINPGSIYNSRAPQLQGTGIEKMYALDAEFEYAMSRPLATDETFPVSSLPWDNIPSMNNKMAASNFIAPSDAKGIK